MRLFRSIEEQLGVDEPGYEPPSDNQVSVPEDRAESARPIHPWRVTVAIITGLWRLLMAIGALTIVGAIIYSVVEASRSAEAKPVLSGQHCEINPFNGSYRALGEVRNAGKTGEVSVRATVELFGGETKENANTLGTMHSGEHARYLVNIAVPEDAHVVGCSASAVSP